MTTLTDCDLAGAFGIFIGFLAGLGVCQIALLLAYHFGIVEYVGIHGEER